MNCSQANSRIDLFLRGSLRGRELRQFLNHVETCRECYDELQVRFLVYSVDQALRDERNSDYNFSKKLQERIDREKKKIVFDRILGVLMGIGGLLLAGLIIYGFFFR